MTLKFLFNYVLILLVLTTSDLYNQNNENDDKKIEEYFREAEYYYELTGKGDSLISIGIKVRKLYPNKSLVSANYYIGSVYLINKEFDKAETYLKASFENINTNKDKNWLAKLHFRFGAFYQNKDNLEKGIYHFLEAIKFSNQVNDYKTLALSNYGVSVIYATQNQRDKQLEYIKKAIVLCNSKIEIPALTKNIVYGSAAQQFSSISATKEFEQYKDTSLFYAKKALAIGKQHRLNQRIPSDLNYIALYHINKGELDKGLSYIKESLDYLNFMKDEAKLNAYQILAHIHRAKQNRKMCYVYLDSINNLSIKQRPYYGSVISNYSYVSYKYFKDYDKAFASLNEYFSFEEQKKEIAQNKTINELEIKHQTELKEAKIQKLNFYLTLAVALILVILFILVLTKLRKSKKSNLALKEAIKQQLKLEKELINVRNNIAQDFHDDLGNKLARISFLSRLVEDELSDADTNIKSKISQVKDDTVSLYVGTKDFIFSLKPNSDYLEEVVTYLSDFGEDYFSETEVQFVLDKKIKLNKKLPHYWSKQLIYIFKEAMTNAFKHAKCSKLILKFVFDDNILIISCIDDGIGVAEQQLSSTRGLLNMKKRAEKIEGTLEIKSSKSKGTSIIFSGRIDA